MGSPGVSNPAAMRALRRRTLWLGQSFAVKPREMPSARELLILATGKDHGSPCWDQHQKSCSCKSSCKRVASLGVSDFSKRLFLHLKAIFQGHFSD